MATKGSKKDQRKIDIENLKREVDVDFHKISVEELLQRFNTSATTGLTSGAAAAGLATYGPNRLSPPKKTPEWIKLLRKMFSGFGIILFLGSALCFIAYGVQFSYNTDPPMDNLWLGIVLFAVVILTGIFAYYQESKSSRIMDSFSKLVPRETHVIRDGRKVQIKVEEVVPGDLVEIGGGDFIPADIRILESSGLKVDNSSLTGESEPQRRGKSSTHDNVLEAENVIFAYTFSVEGKCDGIAVATGDNTMMGGIAKLTAVIKQGMTPIAIEIRRFVRKITLIAVTIGLICFVIAFFIMHLPIIESVIFLIGIIVANVPEGLLATVTLVLTLTAKKMAKKNCLVKNLESVETLGSTSVICSDKTGTLTQNRMTVSHTWKDGAITIVDTAENVSRTEFEGGSTTEDILYKISALCNRAEFKDNQDFELPIARWITLGDASESALVKWVERTYRPLDKVRQQYRKVFEIPFNSTQKYQVSIHDQSEDDSRYLLVMKGAPERIIDRCDVILVEGREESLDDHWRSAFDAAYEEMGGMGERVLGFCYTYLPSDLFPKGCKLAEDDEPLFKLTGLKFVGLVSMIDPARAAVPDAVKLCRDAGIRVVMVTGDHPITAKAIAKNVGIITGDSESYQEFRRRISENSAANFHESLAAVITGADLKDMEADEIDQVIAHHWQIVFARTSPQQKLIIVEAFQHRGCIVAVTGDGVNDAPALRKADIGVAMGIAGSDVAKQAADMILLDDNFASIVTGVEQGRIIFDNLKKSIAYTLTSNIPEIAPFLLNIFFGIPLPLGTITILCIDLGTDMFPAISLAYEKPEQDIMKRNPRNPKKDILVTGRLINFSYGLIGLFQLMSAMLIYYFIMMKNGFSWRELGVGSAWIQTDVPFIVDSYGQEWPYSARRAIEYTSNTAYFMAIVIVQVSDLCISRTRMVSIFTQGVFTNKYLICSIFFEVGLALFISYTPYVTEALSTMPFPPECFFIIFPCAILMMVLDEVRRRYIRRYPNSLIYQETYY